MKNSKNLKTQMKNTKTNLSGKTQTKVKNTGTSWTNVSKHIQLTPWGSYRVRVGKTDKTVANLQLAYRLRKQALSLRNA